MRVLHRPIPFISHAAKLGYGLLFCFLMSGCNQSPLLTSHNLDDDDESGVDLSGDTLQPPALLDLSVTASAGRLNFQWEALSDQRAVRLYRYDASTGEETRLAEYTTSTLSATSIPSETHLHAWQNLFFRIEICNAQRCTSSKRSAPIDIIGKTVLTLAPSVFVEGERFATSLAMDNNARMIVTTHPVEGAVATYLRSDTNWLYSHRIPLTETGASPTRQLSVATSGSGNTIAVLRSQDTAGEPPFIHILSRLGEGWAATAGWSLDAKASIISDSEHTTLAPQQPHRLVLTDSGDALLVHHDGGVYLYTHEADGWSAASHLNSNIAAPDTNSQSMPSPYAFSWKVAAASDFSRLFTLHIVDGSLTLRTWEQAVETGQWRTISLFPLEGFNTTRDVFIHSNRDGSLIAIAGWEATDRTTHTPVMWRYRLPEQPTDRTMNTITPEAIDSLRLPPVSSAEAQLRFSIDRQLENLVMGWQIDDGSTLTGARLLSYRFDKRSPSWQQKLDLPALLPELTEQAFAARTLLSADGKTLLVGSDAMQTRSSNNHVGELMIFR